MVSARWKGRTVHSCTALTFQVPLYCLQVPPQKPCSLLHCFPTEFTICVCLPSQGRGLWAHVCVLFCVQVSAVEPHSAASVTPLCWSLKVWLFQLTPRQCGKGDAIPQGAPSTRECGYRCSGPAVPNSLLFNRVIFHSVRLQLFNIPPSVGHQLSQNENIETTFL